MDMYNLYCTKMKIRLILFLFVPSFYKLPDRSDYHLYFENSAIQGFVENKNLVKILLQYLHGDNKEKIRRNLGFP